MHENVDLTRNSPVRTVTRGIRRKIAEEIYDHSPLRANTLSLISAAGNIAGSKLAGVRQEAIRGDKREAALPAVLIALAVIDGIDGEVGRVQDEKHPGQRNASVGMLVDVLCDRGQERVAAGFREKAARKRGDKLGMLTARGAKISNAWPSTLRAVSEGLGHPVPESGKGVLGVMGTRTGRATLNFLAAVFPEHQAKFDFSVMLANAAVTGQRAKTIFDNRDEPTILSSEVRKDAWIRAGALITSEVIATAATVYTSKMQEKK